MMLTFGEAVRQFYGNYTNAEGRAQRSAYWWALLYQLIIALVLIIVILMADGGIGFVESIFEILTPGENSSAWADMGLSGKAAFTCGIIFGLVNFLPNIMLNIRRFHDLGQSGWLVLGFFVLGAMPVFGIVADVANLIWFAIPGHQGPNQYGQDPLGPDVNIFQ